MQALVSIIIPAYNVEAFIAETIKSVQAQTYQNWEMLITDDLSHDQTRQVIKAFMKTDKRIKLFCLDNNQGPAVARNNSIKNAKGQFIAFLDADDIWYPQKLDVQVKAMLKSKTEVSFSSYQHIDEYGNNLNLTIQAMPSLSYTKLLKNNYIGNLTGMYDASKLGKIYNPQLKKRQDWCLWLQALQKSKKPALGIQQVLAKYRIRKNSISSNKLQLLKYNFQVYHQYLNYNLLKSMIYLLVFLAEYFLVRPKYIQKDKG